MTNERKVEMGKIYGTQTEGLHSNQRGLDWASTVFHPEETSLTIFLFFPCPCDAEIMKDDKGIQKMYLLQIWLGQRGTSENDV